MSRAMRGQAPVDELDYAVTSASLMERLFGAKSEHRIGRYVVRRRIGSGASGRVFLARDTSLDRDVALKVVARTGAESLSAEHRREANALAALSHPNVIAVFEVGTAGDDVFVATQYVPGLDLMSWLAAQPRTRAEIVSVMLDAAHGLAAVHDAGLVHRDVKPTNIVVDEAGRGLIADFGLARRMGDVPATGGAPPIGTQTTPLAGTPAYMAPELAKGATADHRSDQYSYCVALCEALTGERDPSGLPRRLRAVASRARARVPERRFADMHALANAVRSASAGSGRRVWWAAAAALTVGMVAAAMSSGGASREQRCSAGTKDLAARWSATTRGAVRERFAASALPFAAATGRKVEDRLDAYVVELANEFETACASVDGEFDTKLACLRSRRTEATAMIETLADADDVMIAGSLAALERLPDAAGCRDTSGSNPLPSDPKTVAVEQDLARGELLVSLHKVEQARELGKQIVDSARAVGHPALVARALRLRGAAGTKAADPESAQADLEEAYFIAHESGADHMAAQAATELLMEIGYRQARHREATRWHEAGAAALARAGHPAAATAAFESAAGSVATSAGKHEDARARHLRALELNEQRGRPLSIANSLNDLGIAALDLGLYVQAETYLNRSHEIRERELGSNHPLVASTVTNLGVAARRRGNKEAGVAAAVRVVEIREATAGPGHPELAAALNNLGVALTDVGRTEEAVTALTRAREIWIGSIGADHPDVALVLNNLGRAAGEAGDFDGAAAYYREALSVQTAALPAGHPDLGVTHHNLGDTLLNAGRLEQGLPHLDNAIDLFERGLGPQHALIAHPLTSKGIAALDGSRPRAAIPPLRRALEIRQAADVGGDELARTQLALARALWPGGDAAQRKEAVALATAALEGYSGPGPIAAQAQAWLDERR